MSKSIRANPSNSLPKSWDHDNKIKRKKKHETQFPINRIRIKFYTKIK